MSVRQDETGDTKLARRMQNLAGPTLGLYVLVSTLAAVDWIMSLDPLWYSSLFGVYFVGGHGISAFAFVIIFGLWLAKREPMSRAKRCAASRSPSRPSSYDCCRIPKTVQTAGSSTATARDSASDSRSRISSRCDRPRERVLGTPFAGVPLPKPL